MKVQMAADGRWRDVPDGEKAEVHVSGALVIFGAEYPVNDGKGTDRKMVQVFGPGSWVTWDTEVAE